MKILAQTLFCFSLAVTALAISWLGLASVNFVYPTLHDHGGIAEGIEKYGPMNRYKKDFHLTTPEERYELFAAINKAIHTNGKGLAEIEYQAADGSSVKLLREPEVVHLQDVANLIIFMFWVVALFFTIFMILLWCIRKNLLRMPGFKSQLKGLGVAIVVLLIVIFSIGPEAVFNQLHIWVFPDEHQWFFYYQDSLMSTMMLAPLLFAWIAVIWGILALIVYVLLASLVSRFVNARPLI